MTLTSDQFMQKAVELARKGLGRTAPNPPVGAVLVRQGAIVGTGFHPAAGQPHAEIFALREAGELCRGADLYVTLEPCCHTGRTGPCTEAIVAAGVARVFAGTRDPNPQVAGKGLARLQDAGIEVNVGLHEAACRELIRPFAKHLATHLPYVVYKAAMSLDGQTSAAGGDAKWISCPESRLLVHQLRDQVDAIMVGSGTVNADDPRLTTRIEAGGRDPVRIVFDGTLTTSPRATVFRPPAGEGTILVTAADRTREQLEPYREAGVGILQVERREGRLDLRQALVELGKRDLHHLMLEGGRKLAAGMLDAQLIDRMMIFVAPLLLGGQGQGLFAGEGADRIKAALPLAQLRSRLIGADILLEGEVEYVHRPD